MPITATDVDVLHHYAEGVMARAGHHAGQVKGVALALLGGIVWRGEPGSIAIKQYAGSPANVLWATISGKRYAFAYNHASLQIEMRNRTQSGGVVHSFSDSNSVSDVESVFRAL